MRGRVPVELNAERFVGQGNPVLGDARHTEEVTVDDRALLKGHIVPLELLNQVDVILVPCQPDIHLAKGGVHYRPIVSWTPQQPRTPRAPIHSVGEPLLDVLNSSVTFSRADAVVDSRYVLSGVLYATCEAIPHVGLEAIWSPMAGAAIGQRSLGVRLGSRVVS